jgi:hypothetical protein
VLNTEHTLAARLYMCPHTTTYVILLQMLNKHWAHPSSQSIYVSAYYSICDTTTNAKHWAHPSSQKKPFLQKIFGIGPEDNEAGLPASKSVLYYYFTTMCNTIYASSYYYICVRILPACPPPSLYFTTIYVSAYYYISVRILLYVSSCYYMCTTIYASSS